MLVDGIKKDRYLTVTDRKSIVVRMSVHSQSREVAQGVINRSTVLHKYCPQGTALRVSRSRYMDTRTDTDQHQLEQPTGSGMGVSVAAGLDDLVQTSVRRS